jgi:hypothetical protein
MSTPDNETDWIAARAADVAAYLKRTELAHGRVGDGPAWHVMPYASIWAVESLHRPEWVGWWVISGDLPTDGLPAQGVDTPRDAMRAFGKRWVNHAAALDGGEVPQAWRHLPDEALPKLTAQLRARGEALVAWADADEAWPAAAGDANADTDTDD